MQRVRVVTHDFQAAALPWTFRPKGADNDVTSASYRTRDVLNVGDSLFHCRQKMEYGAVMPNIVCKRLEFGSEDIGNDPLDVVGGFSHPLLRDVDCGLRNIEHGDVLISAFDKIVGQSGFAAAYINDGGRKTRAGSLNETQRRFEMRQVPADGVRRFFFVNFFPMCFCVHGEPTRLQRTMTCNPYLHCIAAVVAKLFVWLQSTPWNAQLPYFTEEDSNTSRWCGTRSRVWSLSWRELLREVFRSWALESIVLLR